MGPRNIAVSQQLASSTRTQCCGEATRTSPPSTKGSSLCGNNCVRRSIHTGRCRSTFQQCWIYKAVWLILFFCASTFMFCNVGPARLPQLPTGIWYRQCAMVSQKWWVDGAAVLQWHSARGHVTEATEDASSATTWWRGAHNRDHGSAQDTERTHPPGFPCQRVAAAAASFSA